jgi:hypothetical protein
MTDLPDSPVDSVGGVARPARLNRTTRRAIIGLYVIAGIGLLAGVELLGWMSEIFNAASHTGTDFALWFAVAGFACVAFLVGFGATIAGTMLIALRDLLRRGDLH